MRKLKVKKERSIILMSTFIIIYTRFHHIKYKRCKKYLRNYKSKFVFNTGVKKIQNLNSRIHEKGKR